MATLVLENASVSASAGAARWFPEEARAGCGAEGVSFEVEAGGGFGLVGDEGSGKFSLACAVLGQAPVSSGRILLEGVEVSAMGERSFRPLRRRVQAVFGDGFGQFDPDRTVGEALEETVSLWWRGEGREERLRRIDRAVIACGMPEGLKRLRPGELDAVERLKAAVARALLAGPALLVCLEVTDGFDAVETAEALNLLASLREPFALSLLTVTRDLAVALHLSDTLGVLHRGRLLECGSADSVVSAPRHDYTRRLVSCSLQAPWP